jgi:hypothetical protein
LPSSPPIIISPTMRLSQAIWNRPTRQLQLSLSR